MMGRDLKRGIKVLAGGAGEIAEKLAKKAEKIALKIQINNIEREIRSSYHDLGIIAFEKIANGERDLHKDEKIKEIKARIREDSMEKARLLSEEEI